MLGRLVSFTTIIYNDILSFFIVDGIQLVLLVSVLVLNHLLGVLKL